ncbi:aminotransferase class I/II-fold pyridoxal phosphate-dependent enzyme [Geodermatophilus sp. SYSU D00697]
MKSSVDDLALFGGVPAFDEELHVGRPNVGDEEQVLAQLRQILCDRWLTNDGRRVKQFEQRLAGLLGTRHCVATSSGTVALQLAARAVGLSGEVIVPSFTFIGTAHALEWMGVTPVFCEVVPETHLIDPDHAASLVTSRTTGILGVHLWGRACDVEALERIARHHRLKLLFDAAHALGSSRGDTMIGNFGDAEAFSFHATKVCNTFEGGAVATNDDALADAVRAMRNFGFAGYDDVRSIGINGKMHEASAAMGLASLDCLDNFIAHNRANYESYRSGLAGTPGIRLLPYDDADAHNYHYVVVTVDPAAAGLTRDDLAEVLWAERVLARRYFHPGCHRAEPYRSRPASHQVRLPVTEDLAERVLCLPTGTAVGADDTTGICDLIRFCVHRGQEIARRLRPPHRVGGR